MPDTVYGWVTIAEADTYMTTRLGAADIWVSGAEKAAALKTAYNDLVYCKRFTFPSEASQAMKDAQCEQALFRILDSGVDERSALQAQGVTQAGIVKETYQGFNRNRKNTAAIPISLYAYNMLAGYAAGTNAFVADLTRDEDEDNS